MSVGSLQFSSGKAEIIDVNRCVGDVSSLLFIFVLFSMYVIEWVMMMIRWLFLSPR